MEEKKRALEKAETEVDPSFKARSSKREPSWVSQGEWGKAPSEALACLLMYSSIFIMISANCRAEEESHNPGLCEETHYPAHSSWELSFTAHSPSCCPTTWRCS